MILFADAGCPFAHRVNALLAHLGAPLELRESAIGSHPDGLTRYVASGRLPVLVDGDLVLFESRVMLEHLAEHFGFEGAFPAELSARSRDRHAMAIVDNYFAPMLFQRSGAIHDELRFDDALRAVIEAVRSSSSTPRLLTFHVVPILACFRLWHPAHAVTRAMEVHPVLGAWVEEALALDAFARTALAPSELDVLLSRARELGLLPSP